MFLNSIYILEKLHTLHVCACFQYIWHLLIIHKHKLLCSLPHGDIRIVIWPLVIWPIIVLKFSYGHHQICQTPFKVIHICCFFHDSRPPYAKSVAFKIHSIEIEDQSHHWLPVVYLHEDTKGHLLSRWIAEKKTDCLIFSSSFWSFSPQSHFYFHVWKHHHFSHVNDLSFLYHQKNHCHIGHHTIQARLSHRIIMLSDHNNHDSPKTR